MFSSEEGVLDASDDWLKEKLAAWREEDINRPPKNVTFITGDGGYEDAVTTSLEV